MTAADETAGSAAPARSRGTAARPPHRPRRVIERLIVTALLVGGAVVSLLPVVTAVTGARSTTSVATTYSTEVRALPQHEVADALAAAQRYNASLNATTITDPWGSRNPASSADHDVYEQLLDLTGDGTMGRVRVPQIDVDLPIAHDATEDSMSRAAGHMYGSSLPVGGEGTHAVIAAHTGNELTFFDRLPELREGQSLTLEVAGRTMTYEVSSIDLVEATDLSRVRLVQGQDLVTLVTCFTPPGGHKMRLLVTGHRVPNPDTTTAVVHAGWTSHVPGYQSWMLPRAVVAVVAVVVLLAVTRGWCDQDRAARRRARAAQADASATDRLPTESSSRSTL